MRGRTEPASDAAPGRVCGTCSLCCTVLRVDPLRKLGGVDCVHQRGGEAGCAIHGRAERPALCGAYRCAWLKGQLDLADRPDRARAAFARLAALRPNDPRPVVEIAFTRPLSKTKRWRLVRVVRAAPREDVPAASTEA